MINDIRHILTLIRVAGLDDTTLGFDSNVFAVGSVAAVFFQHPGFLNSQVNLLRR